MITPTDKALDGLVAALREKTGHNWERHMAWDVKVTIMVNGRSWSYLHQVKLMALDADPAMYVDIVLKDFKKRLNSDK